MLISALLVRLALLPAPGLRNDAELFRTWLSAMLHDGPLAVYQVSNADHPPLGLLIFLPVGWAYQAVGGDLSNLDAPGLLGALKLPGIAFDLALICLVYGLVRRVGGVRRALLAALLIGFNPALFFDTAVWGQTDSMLVCFLVCSVGALRSGRWVWAWAFFGLALLARLQAIVLLPLLVAYTLRAPCRQLLFGPGLAALLVGAVLAPFVMRSGPSALRPYLGTFDSYPYLTLNALNFWYLATPPDSQGHRLQTTDKDLLFPGGPSAKQVGLLLVGLAAGAIVLRIVLRPNLNAAFFVAGVLYLSFFMLPTQIHERYLYPAVPLLMVAAFLSDGTRRWLPGLLVAGLSFTLLYSLYPTLGQGRFPLFIAYPVLALLNGLLWMVAMIAVLGGAVRRIAPTAQKSKIV